MAGIEELFNTQTSIYLLFAASFFGGVIASVSPCSLSMLPLIVGYVGGYSKEKPAKTFIQMIMFVMGTAVVFSVIGLVCALTGKVFVGNPYFSLIISSIILVMGLKILGVIDFEIPVIIKEMPKNRCNNDFLYPLILGSAFALIGTPCSTPILAGIMAFASMSANVVNAVIMLFLFSLGQGLILIFAGVITSKLKDSENFYKFSDGIMKICGILLIFVSVYIYYKIFGSLLVK